MKELLTKSIFAAIEMKIHHDSIRKKKLDTYAPPMHTHVKFALGAFGGYVGSFGSTVYLCNNTQLHFAFQSDSDSNCHSVIKIQSIFYLSRTLSISLNIHKQFHMSKIQSYMYWVTFLQPMTHRPRLLLWT
jgi:hypothetical protein